MKISFITTVFNEAGTIVKFLDSLAAQTRLPDEIIVVDGGSQDQTVSLIKNYSTKFRKHTGKFVVLVKIGNRSVGRNEAVRNATGDIIVCTDAGNVLDKRWVENITKLFNKPKIDVVAGYYKGLAKNVFQKCVIPYALVMPDKVDPGKFLPATRSLAFKKTIWEKVGGFDEQYSHNEDYVFAQKLKRTKASITFAKDAIVYWLPRSTFKQAFIMFFRFALGDAEARIFRSKVLLIFVRYVFVWYVLFLTFLYRSFVCVVLLIAFLCLYIIWSVIKNYRYVNDRKAFLVLPLLQFTADLAVISGTIIGILKRIKQYNVLLFIKRNKFLIVIVIAYSFIELFLLRWGIPGSSRPFPFHMDEWHQMHAVATTFRNGTPNIAGSANGTMFHFLLSGFYLAPFAALHLVNPFSLRLDDLATKTRLFEILRINTLLFGVLSIFTINLIAKISRLSTKLVLFLFIFTPIWLSLSSYFKYDIALIFWIVFSLYFLLRFAEVPRARNYFIAAVPAGLAVAVKISALPILLLYGFSFFLFTNTKKRNYRVLICGIGVVIACLILFGMPDMLFGKGNIYNYLYANLIQSPQDTTNFQLQTDPYTYLLFHDYPIIFGHGVMLLFAFSIVYWLSFFFKKDAKTIFQEQKALIFFFFGLLVFAVSLLPLQVWASGNRSLVLLPFIIFIIGKSIQISLSKSHLRAYVMVFIVFACFLQLYDTFAILHMKFAKSPEEASSLWIEKNIPKNTIIGIENIPVYQLLPDIIQKEFYFTQYHVSQKSMFFYQVIDAKTQKLPSVIVITNDTLDVRLYKNSTKKNLVNRLKRQGYKKITTFFPDIKFYAVFGNDIDYYFSGLIAAPYTTSVYKK